VVQCAALCCGKGVEAQDTFSKVSLLRRFVCKMTIELTFENFRQAQAAESEEEGVTRPRKRELRLCV